MGSKGNYFKVYQASAGSGKTFTIVKEYLKLCLACKEDMSNYRKILAVTFTNKSANDMKAKVLNHLIEIINGNAGTSSSAMEEILLQELNITREALQKNASELFHNIIHDYSSFCISTIDAFVQKLSRTFAKDLNLPNQYSVIIDDDEFSDHIIDRIGDQIGEDNEHLTKVLVDFVKEKMEDESDWNVEKVLRSFIKKLLREEAYERNETINLAESSEYKTTREFLENKIKVSDSKIRSFAVSCNSIFAKYGIEKEDLYQGSKGFYGFVQKLNAGETPSPNKYVLGVVNGQNSWFSKTGEKKGLQNLNAHNQLCCLATSFFQNYQQELGQMTIYKSILKDLYLYALRSKIKAEANAYIEESQKVHISEFNKRLADILDDFSVPFIYERIGEKFEHFFVDEFQDTSLLQWQNFLPLIDESLSKNHMNLIVGDGKQSIYRFRNGEVEQLVNLPEIYMKPKGNTIIKQYENNLKSYFKFFNLNQNYRSFTEIVNFNNAFFEHCLNFLSLNLQRVYKDKNGNYGKCVSIKQESVKAEKGLVQVELFNEENLKNNPDPNAPILSRIKELISELSTEYDYKDITILTRSNAKGSLIANYLNDNNIPVISADSILLKSSDRVQLIIQTLTYFIHDDNSITIASLIYFWKSTHDKDFDGKLNGFFSNVNTIAAASDQLEPTIALATGKLTECLSRAQSLYDLCSALIRLYDFNSIQDPYLNFFMDEVHNWQSSEELGIAEFLKFWEKKKTTFQSKLPAVPTQ
jgi:ATP-dependent exoDNAse (exonuclease V) beta subunit (contains helicase and exonuclease domains)